ncbi:MAG: crossover junction endodeoxyribonuclease RuvC [Parcubacteria group bacterium]
MQPKAPKGTRPRPNRVVAVDPGFDRLGVAVLEKEGGKEKLLFSECIVTNPKDERGKRLHQIGARLKEIIKEWEPASLAVETLFFNQNITSAIGVAEARGVVIYEAVNAGLAVFEYGPQSIKVAVTGYGKADKLQIESMVKRLVSVPETGGRLDDEVDAIALGITHLASQKSI